jgi:hypothetical protein
MIRILCVVSVVAALGLAVWGVITIYDENLQVGRMWETPAVKPHEEPIPLMDANVIPVHGGERAYRLTAPDRLRPPFDLGMPDVIKAGRIGYERYCIHCHGKYHDGLGTVGQSFSPLPGDLRSEKVQSLTAGQLFHEISYGIPGGRQPPLATTIDIDERWKIIGLIKSLGLR